MLVTKGAHPSFIHIPKTAGTSFSYILGRNFRGSYHYLHQHLEEGPIDSKYIQKCLSTGTYLRALGSHRLTGDIPYDQKDYKVIGIAFVRSPTERLLSEYYYLRNSELKNEITKSTSLEDFLSKLESGMNLEVDYQNRQSECLQLPLEDLSNRIDDGQLHIFPTNQFDEALLVLNKLYPDDFWDVSYDRKNINKKKPDKSDEAIVERIKHLTKRDQDLYQLTQNHMNQISSSVFSEGELERRLKRHQRNCKIRSRLLEPIANFIENVAKAVRRKKLSQEES